MDFAGIARRAASARRSGAIGNARLRLLTAFADRKRNVATASTGLHGTRYAALDALGSLDNPLQADSQTVTTEPNATATPFL
jgi:hypothetical protein